MNENLKRILSQKAKIHIRIYLKKWNKEDYDCWWLLKDILKEYINQKKLCENLNEIQIDESLENLIQYLKKTFSNKNQIEKELKKYQKEYYNKRKKGNEMTGVERALNTARIKREKSFNLVLDSYEKLKRLNQKTTISNILLMINNELSKAQVSRYLKEIKTNQGEK
ncbi:hypothetical protein PJV94_07015 [Aliarcobacter butzleri]|uniref:hypothetical protein n=1 Tax=Aliarcobacter butzleri TaxID=28197 RepID=UPI00263D26D9|nr:hypothetical protein [Aliarcobacter butzleri]MDN5073372.1 hypothetical protein [Aliarcobacter butzleri]MDN5121426.1 hypothetical protein [Aliarcobacter butzleri]MDN5130835.1 hypothetical protein [Aliarcobacter butzleri]